MLTIQSGFYGIDLNTPLLGLMLIYGDCEVRVGKRAVGVMWAGRGSYRGLNVLARSPTVDAVWFWDKARRWFKRG